MTDSVVTPTVGTPGIVAYGGGAYGPAYSSLPGAEAALFTNGSVERNASAVATAHGFHFVRDAIERRQDAAELRAEIKSINSRFDSVYAVMSGVQLALASQENARLKSEVESNKFALLIEQLKDVVKPPKV